MSSLPKPTIKTNEAVVNPNNVWVEVRADTIFLVYEKKNKSCFEMNVDLSKITLPCKIAEKALLRNSQNIWISSWQKWDDIPSDLFQKVAG